MRPAGYRSMIRIIQSIQSKVVRQAEVERVIMWLFEALRLMRANAMLSWPCCLVNAALMG